MSSLTYRHTNIMEEPKKIVWNEGIYLTSAQRFMMVLNSAGALSKHQKGREEATLFDWSSESWKNIKYGECRIFETFVKMYRHLEKHGEVPTENLQQFATTREQAEKEINKDIWHSETIVDDILNYLHASVEGGKEGRIEERITANTLTLICATMQKLFIQKTDGTTLRDKLPDLIREIEKMRHWLVKEFGLLIDRKSKGFLGYLEFKIMCSELLPAVLSQKDAPISFELAISSLAAFSVAFFTGTRPGALYITPAYHPIHFTDHRGELHTLCWREVSFTRVHCEGGMRIQVEDTLRWLKGFHMLSQRCYRPYFFHPVEDVEHLFTDPTLWFFVWALWMDVLDLPAFETLEELFTMLRDPNGGLSLRLQVKPSAKDMPVFPVIGRTGNVWPDKPATTSHLASNLKTILRLCSLPEKLTFYGWRYEFVERNKRQGMPDEQIKSLLGHKENSPVMNAAYSQVTAHIDLVGKMFEREKLPKNAAWIGPDSCAVLRATHIASLDQELLINKAVFEDHLYKQLVARVETMDDDELRSAAGKNAREALSSVVKRLKVKARQHLRHQWNLAKEQAKISAEVYNKRFKHLIERNPLPKLVIPVGKYPAEVEPQKETDEIAIVEVGDSCMMHVSIVGNERHVRAEPADSAASDADTDASRNTSAEACQVWWDNLEEIMTIGHRYQFDRQNAKDIRCPFADLGFRCTNVQRDKEDKSHRGTDAHLVEMLERIKAGRSDEELLSSINDKMEAFISGQHYRQGDRRFISKIFKSYLRCTLVHEAMTGNCETIKGAGKRLIQVHTGILYKLMGKYGRVYGEVSYQHDDTGHQNGLYKFFGGRSEATRIATHPVKVYALEVPEGEKDDKDKDQDDGIKEEVQEFISQEVYDPDMLSLMAEVLTDVLALLLSNYIKRLESPDQIGLVADEWRERIDTTTVDVLAHIERHDTSVLDSIVRGRKLRNKQLYDTQLNLVLQMLRGKLVDLGCPECFMNISLLTEYIRSNISFKRSIAPRKDARSIALAAQSLPQELGWKRFGEKKRGPKPKRVKEYDSNYAEWAVDIDNFADRPITRVQPFLDTVKPPGVTSGVNPKQSVDISEFRTDDWLDEVPTDDSASEEEGEDGEEEGEDGEEEGEEGEGEGEEGEGEGEDEDNVQSRQMIDYDPAPDDYFD
ncbi:hypothetical protein BJ508DRAFT_310173 [Ascobolus immersus RN42]|uniref:Uncharacterized protein n=1 Tax=Ascobolus immersus RN42 TaxID=1160509 RepID=A0A3N4HU56_ASCIM|nr:hypothetical protein BJ508DRAFT_310173 [Ascobolus immersus RN42]